MCVCVCVNVVQTHIRTYTPSSEYAASTCDVAIELCILSLWPLNSSSCSLELSCSAILSVILKSKLFVIHTDHTIYNSTCWPHVQAHLRVLLALALFRQSCSASVALMPSYACNCAHKKSRSHRAHTYAVMHRQYAHTYGLNHTHPHFVSSQSCSPSRACRLRRHHHARLDAVVRGQ